MKKKRQGFSKDFDKCAAFHGHICPGLTIGYRAAKAALDRLKESMSVDEEIITIIETDACGADAIQVLTGCTFGKGNLIYRDHGKTVFTFISRLTEKGVRFSLKPSALETPKEAQDTSSEDFHLPLEGGFSQFRPEMCRKILEMPFEELFTVSDTVVKIPSKARIEQSELCEACREPVMPSRMLISNGRKVCRDCAEPEHGK